MKRAIRDRGKQPEKATDNAEAPKPKARGRPKKHAAKNVDAGDKPKQCKAASSTAEDTKGNDTGSKDDDDDAKQEPPATPSKEPADKGEGSTGDGDKRKAEDNTTPNKGGPRKRKTKKDPAAKAADDDAVKTAWKAQD